MRAVAGTKTRAVGVVDVDPRPRLLGIEDLHVIRPVAVLAVGVDELAHPGHPRLGLCDVDVPAADLPRVDALSFERLEDLVDRVEERRLGRLGRTRCPRPLPTRPGRAGRWRQRGRPPRRSGRDCRA